MLEAEVIQRNPASLNAEQAGIFITFPEGTEEYEDDTDPPETPAAPGFPVRKSTLGQMLDTSDLQDPYRGIFDSPSWGSQLADIEEAAVFDQPDYDRTLDGSFEVFYGRWPIRHHEERVSGEPFSVRLPDGTHEIRWKITASNLPRPATGNWTVTVQTEIAGEPITTVAEMEAALRGEAHTSLDWDAILSAPATDAED